MPKAKPGFYFFVVCVNCGEDIILRARPVSEKGSPKMRASNKLLWLWSGAHLYHPSTVRRGRRGRMAMDTLNVVVDGTSIKVTMPGTDFAVAYQKRFANPHLVLTRSWIAGSVADSPPSRSFVLEPSMPLSTRRASSLDQVKRRRPRFTVEEGVYFDKLSRPDPLPPVTVTERRLPLWTITTLPRSPLLSTHPE